MNNPKVSIICITYNHEKFIRQTLDSFLMQKTDFNFEIIIGEDCSFDNTRTIIKEFEDRYPEIIRPVYRDKNIGVMKNLVDILKRAKGDFLALCEGDDFFIDREKLQLQADFLDENPDYSICFHPVKVFFENNEKKESIYPRINNPLKFNLEELLKWNFIQTNSVMYRRKKYDNIPVNILPGDYYLHLYHARFGKVGYIPKVMASYRRHMGGIWWEAQNSIDGLLKKHGVEHFTMYCEVLKLFNHSHYKEIVLSNMSNMMNRFMVIDRKTGTELFKLSLLRNLDYLLEIKFFQETFEFSKEIHVEKGKYSLKHRGINLIARKLGLNNVFRIME